MNSGCAPQRVFPAHPPNQITQAPIDLRPPCTVSGFPTPERLKASAMPPQDRLRLNLSLPKIISGRSDDAIRTESAW